MRKYLTVEIGAGLILVLGGLLVWAVVNRSPSGNGPPGMGGPPVMPVEAVPVTVGTVIQEVETIGSLEANESVVIRSEIPGRIESIRFLEGRKVAAGVVLVTIDPAEHEAQHRQIKAAVELNQSNFDRAQQLHEEKMISPQAYDEAEARLKESQANLALVQARLEKTTIRAPFGGRLGLRQVSPGDYVQPGRAIVNLEDIDSIKVDFRIPEIYLGLVKSGQTIRVGVDAFPNQAFDGRIFAIDPRIDAESRTILLRGRVPNPDGNLRPGMFARATLQLAERTQAVLIPEQAIVPIGEDKFVYRILDGRAALTPVEIGQRKGGRVEITQGLGPNETVVVAGQAKIFEGAAVMVVIPPAPAGPVPIPAKP